MSIDTPISPSSSSNYPNRDNRRRFGAPDNQGFGIATGPGGEKPIPHNAEAEEAVIGALLIDRDTIVKVAPLLRPADFFSEELGAIFQAMLDLYEERTPNDLITLRDELKRRGKLGESEGQVKAARLFSMMHSTPSPVHVEHYAKIVLRYAIMRRLIGAGAQVTALGFDEQLETQEMIDQAQQLVMGVVQEGVKREAIKVGAILEEYFDRLAFLNEHKGEIIGVPSGYIDLDKLTGGFQQSDLIILAARPATGKTSLALGIAYNIVMDRVSPRPVGVFSLEMSREQLVQRMLAMETGVDSHRLRTGYIDETEWDRVSHAFGKLATAPLYIDDSAGITIMELRSRARRLHAEYGIELLIIDYLQLMVGSRNENRVQEVSEISRNLKGIARELNIPVICLSQLSRAVESRTSHVPQLSDLRESGCLSGDSLVYLPDSGTYQRIDQLIGQEGFNVLALNIETWKLEPRPVLKAFATGVKPVYQMTTRLGRTIKATANHKFVTIHGWQRLDELAPGTRIALPRNLPEPTQPQSAMSEAELVVAMQTAGITSRQMQAALGNAYCGTGLYKQNISRERATRLAEVVQSEELAKLAHSDVYWDEIISIEPVGEEEVYDLTVEGLHNFVINDIICHNSIEQDSDIVMFIYREDMYDPNTEKKGIAEIYVSKHRNGPTGVVPLLFRNNTTRFENIDPYRQAPR